MTLEEIAGTMRERLAGSDFTRSVKFDCGTDGAVLVAGRNVSVSDGSADCLITLTKGDLQALLAGEMDPTAAFMEGKIRVDGDLSVAIEVSQAL
ncbi:SCP2 sterol-binding domain-containing protein [Chelativorans sp. Marseille-P2723]|uniref:SCP2 sterol-binding domain-containing protein n=1 Tax=Chelativorans sp. Marseille-P2723 TaxID=2709133 RepID=UPI0015709318|nr:SCP2 sterol-binding domain-containing protein [Chelativorans sp. Marseille-P2723]